MSSFIIRGDGVPTITPEYTGRFFIDETNDKMYSSVHTDDATGWIEIGAGATLDASQIKSLYESNTDTNAFTDAYKTKVETYAITLAKVSDVDYIAQEGDYIVAFTHLTQNRTVHLPTPNGNKRAFIIKDESGMASCFPITISPIGSTINGFSNISLTVQNSAMIIYTDGVNYFTVTGATASTTGQVKLNTGNSIKPEIAIDASNESVLQQITYGTPLGLSAYPTTKFPQNIGTPSDADLYDFPNDSFIENTVAGQPSDWRIVVSYTGKAINSTTGVRMRISNPLSGFILEDTKFLPNEVTSGWIVFKFSTIADSASLPSPHGTGHGYELAIAADDPINFKIEHVTRFSRKVD